MKKNKLKLQFSGKALLAVDNNSLRSAGFSATALRLAGFSASDVLSLTKLVKDIPKLIKPYTKLWEDIKSKKRQHKQSTWGPNNPIPCDNICGTPMCTAGHLVNMAGLPGYKLKDTIGWKAAAKIIHEKSHPNIPHQNFNNIPQDTALAYIERMAEIENEK